ncbi:MAG: carboxypeptidase regulatory-like domain-containing protein [Acidobacteriota bacterium]|nr:carboxypeptidase regulatory-like domain-containing protein [Acidobacteriota bacterium]
MRAVIAFLASLLAMRAFAADVAGRVYAPDGTPVAATISAYLPESSADQQARRQKRAPRTAVATAKTSEGAFKLSGLPDGVIDVDVRAEGYAPEVARAISGETSLVVSLQRAAVIEGRVTARGKGVADAYVIWLGAIDVEYGAATDANGRYRVPDPRFWARHRMVIHPQFASAERDSGADIEVEPKRNADVPRGEATLTGTVTLNGKPLANAPVQIYQESVNERVITNAKGVYVARGLRPLRTGVSIGEGLTPRVRLTQTGRDYEGMPVDLTKQRSATADIALTLAPTISGRVVDADEKPVPNAHVQIVLEGRSSLEFASDAFVRTASDGTYAIAAPPYEPAAQANVAVTPPKSVTVRSKPFRIEGDRRVDITLPRMIAVRARVLDAKRNPLPNARLAFANAEETTTFSDMRLLLLPPLDDRAIRTDASGEALVQLVAGTYDFAAEAEGFQLRAVQQEIGKAGTVDIALEPSFTIRGRVHRKEVGVAGVHVVLMTDIPMRQTPVTTGADGRFELTGLARERYRLLLMKSEEMIESNYEVEAPGSLDIALPPSGTLRGQVIDAVTREPVPQFVYTLEALDAPEDLRNPNRVLERAERGGNGTFNITLSAGRYRITAASTGFTMSEPVEVRVSERAPAEVRIALERGAKITGRVTDDNGTPIAGAEIFASGVDPERLRLRSARVAPGNGRSAEDGTFTITGLEPGTVTLYARKEGFVPFRKAVVVDAGTTIDIRLGRGLTLEGVVTRGGKPVAEAQINATTSAIGSDFQSATTDADGHFTLQGLMAARYTIGAMKEDAHAEVRDVDPSRTRELAITLDPKPRAIVFGTVSNVPRTLDGKIVRRAVSVIGENDGAEGMIDDNGNYRIESAPAGRVSIVAQVESPTGGRSSEQKEVELLPGQPQRVDLDLGSAVSVNGRVTREGKAVAGVRVVMMSEGGIAASGNSRADGAFDIALPAAGTFQIFATSEGMTGAPYQSVREIRGGETIQIELREQIVEGVVTDAATHEPMRGVYVSLVPDAAVTEAMAGETVTNGEGRFRIVTAAAGPHRAIAWARGYAQGVQPLQLGNGRGATLTFELQRIEPLRVRVFDARTGTPLEAHLVITTREGAAVPVRGDSTPDGDAMLFSLAEGKYRIRVIAAGYEEKVVDVTAPGSVDIGL